MGKSQTFRSLWVLNYRIWFIGALVSNIGTWMQRIAQDWLVFNELSDHDSTAMGIVMSLQFGPQILVAPYAGALADKLDRRKMLYWTQGGMGLLSLGLGALVISGQAQIWHVYLFALALGIVSSLDAPIRQTFVSELVSDRDLPNAVALNSMSFNSARMIGPAIAGVLVAVIGSGPVFLINTITFLAMFLAIFLIRTDQLRMLTQSKKGASRMRDGFGYLKDRPDIIIVMISVFLIGSFGLNSAMNIAAMATTQFGKGAGEFGGLNSVMAIGSVCGTLLAARRDTPRMRFIFISALAFGIASLFAAISPNILVFSLALIPMGFSALSIITSANAYVQVTTDEEMRGRVMSLYMAVFVGGTPIGAPLVGLVNDHIGARWGLGVAAASGIIAAVIGITWYMRSQHMRLGYDSASRSKVVFKPRTEIIPIIDPHEEIEAQPVTAAIDIQQPR